MEVGSSSSGSCRSALAGSRSTTGDMLSLFGSGLRYACGFSLFCTIEIIVLISSYIASSGHVLHILVMTGQSYCNWPGSFCSSSE